VSVLDDPARIEAVDPGGMLGIAEATADHWRDGYARARAASLDHIPDHAHLTGVVVCGMGGSGIAGDVAACLASERGSMPVVVVKGYRLPAFAGPSTLVVLSSYSGSTEETLECFEQAHHREAPVAIVSSGGRLAELAHAHDAPMVTLPAGMMPRAAFPYLASAPLAILERIGVLGDLTGDLVETDEVIREQTSALGREVEAERNPAKQLAASLLDRIPLVWGQEGPLAVAAGRWKTQLNENAKVPAFSSVLSELGHNEVMGYDPGVDALNRIAIVALRSASEDVRIARRLDATMGLVSRRVGGVYEAHARGTGTLACLASAVQFGDLVSVYLAILRGVDPTPIDAIARLKAQLG
jgi:glucose/mannose-6-phosphate isomerase